MKVSRREFVAMSGAGAFSLAAVEAESPLARPMRWAQLAFVEDDPKTFDLGFWMDYFRRIHADGACLSAGGCVAFYPTQIPFHYKSKYLGGRDLFGELARACKKQGMVVLARTDPHAIHEDAAKAHPEWVAVDAEGRKRRHWAHPDYWVTCAMGPYNYDFMTAVTREIAERYEIDGVFSNRWAGHGICYCDACREMFRAYAGGLELPRTANPQDKARRAYLEWHDARLFEIWRRWDEEIRKVRPAARFVANSGGGALSDLDMKTCGELAAFLAADRQARRGLMAPWAAGKNGKEYRAALGEKPVAGLFSVGVEEPYRWKDSVQVEPELRVWSADATANGMRPWFVKFRADVEDKRWMPVIEKIYGWHYRNEKYLRNVKPLADVGLVYSQQTAKFYGGERARARVEDHIEGWYQALIEARVPFEMVHDRLLERAAGLRVLILPNVAAMSEKQCAQVREYVRGGGNVVATYETSLYDEWGVRRANLGLADVLGCDYAGRVEARMQNSYLRIEDAAHPLVRGIAGTPRIINAAARVDVKARGTVVAPLTLIPSYPDLPMEEVYPREARTSIPQVILSEFGKGRVVYFPGDLDRTFWEVMAPDHGLVLANAVDWAAGGKRVVDVRGAGLLDVTVWRQAASATVHLVNLTNPMAMRGPYRELIPVGEQRVTVTWPGRPAVRKVTLLSSGAAPRWNQTKEGPVFVTVPSVLDHEVIAFDF
ncbi:MAG: beta-galactosidase trimerization domain-containing protein [Bryobacteraceae bacterium]|nr:beta-galactosidase trimerization domain-containing protein [Bryobacteraceae bacterium]